MRKVRKSGKKGEKLDIKHEFSYEYGQKEGKMAGNANMNANAQLGKYTLGKQINNIWREQQHKMAGNDKCTNFIE